MNKHYAIALILPALLGSIPIFLLYKRHKTTIKLVYDSVLFWTASVLMLKYVIYTFPKIVENMLSILSKGTIHDNFFDILFTNRAGYSLLITLSMCALAKALATSSDLYDEVIKIIVVKKNINRERLINEKIKKYLW
ncbi:hypothetical protein [Rahnella sp. CJA17(1/100)]|uniref:hypothetical protein n=1 Tax=Rahnella sp. CJA17(1/100) TaxID=2508951 RepID=UPI00106FF130|nr:hypothetical protein [Rahnella sp. CJA17(1/100)]